MKKLDFESLKYYTGDEKPFQVLSQDGELVDKDLMPDLTDEQLVDLFKEMIWSRVVGDRSTKLNRQGRLGFIAPTQGQEASEMASNYAMEKDDFLAGAYRDIPQLVKHGLPLAQAFMWSKGHYNGTKFPEELKALPPQIIIGAQYVQTAGIALGLKKKGTKNVAYHTLVMVVLLKVTSMKGLTSQVPSMLQLSSLFKITDMVFQFHGQSKPLLLP